MNWKTTLGLLILAGAAGAWWWKGDEWAARLQFRQQAPAAADSPSLAAIAVHFDPAKLTRVEIPAASGDPFVLERPDATAAWRLPGGWPVREQEVGELVGVLGNLRTRFQPIPLADADLSRYGLTPSQNPITVKVTADGKLFTLTFGEPAPSPDEPAFTRPAFVRVNDYPEVLRLGPDVMPVLRRPPDSYRRRQLVPDAERVKVAVSASPPSPFDPSPPGGAAVTVALLGDTVKEVEVRGPGGKARLFGAELTLPNGAFTLRRTGPTPQPVAAEKGADPALTPDRLALAWALVAPVRDRVEPEKLRKLLAAVPDLWVEEFAYNTDQLFALADLLAAPSAGHLAVGAALLDHAAKPDAFLKRTGLEKPERTLTVTRADGTKVVIQFGAVAKTGERDEPVTLPGGPPGAPPRTITRKVPEEYRFARLANNPQVFVVRADKFADLFTRAGDLKDPKVVRFNPDEVERITIGPADVRFAVTRVMLHRKRGNPKAETPAGRADRWYMNDVLADSAKVEELLNQLANLQAAGPDDVIADPDLKAFGLDFRETSATGVGLVLREKRAEGQPEAPVRSMYLVVGRPNVEPRRQATAAVVSAALTTWIEINPEPGAKVPVHLNDWPRVDLVANQSGPDPKNSLTALLDRDSLAYRSRRLFDTAEVKLDAIKVETTGSSFALQRDGSDWKLAQPVLGETDSAKASQLVASLSGLEATEYVRHNPILKPLSPEELAKYGLDSPRQTVTLSFTGPGGRDRKLEIGGPREGKPEVYARLDGGDVFTLASSAIEPLNQGALGLLPLRVWQVPLERVTAAEVTRAEGDKTESYSLTKDGTNWKLAGPFEAPVPFLSAQPVLAPLANLTAVRYQALAAPEPGVYGFDKPFVRVKLSYTETKPAAAGMPEQEQQVTKTLLVGGPTPDGTGRYAKLDGPDRPVFVVDEPVVAAARTPALDLLDKKLLFVSDPGRITKLQLAGARPEESLTLVKDDKGTWKAEGATFAVDAEAVDRLVQTFADLPVRKLAAYGDTVKWAEYGLDPAELTVTATLAGDKTHTVKLGKPDPAGGRFARVDEGKAVAVLEAAASADLARGRLEFVDRTLLRFDPAALMQFTRKKGDEELEIAPGTAVGWDILKPAKHKADKQLMDDLADALGRLRAERVAAFGPKEKVLAEYGLDQPEFTLTLVIGEKAEAKVVRIGKPADKPEGGRYAVVEGPGDEAVVGVLPAALAQKLTRPPVGFRDHTLARFVDADKAVLERGDRKVTFAKVNGTWKVTDPVQADAEQADLEELAAKLGQLRAEEVVAEKGDAAKYGLDKPEAKWTLSDGGKDVLVLVIGKKDRNRAYATTAAGELIGLLSPDVTAKVLGEYRRRKAWDGVDALQVESIEVTRGGAKFQLEKQGAVWVDPARPKDPIDVRAVNELLGTLAGLRVERYAIDREADPKLFGLDEPEGTITVTQRDGSKRVLHLGGAVGGTDGKQVYARVADPARTDVFVLSEADTARLTRDRGVYGERK
jgi:hypothetical protein